MGLRLRVCYYTGTQLSRGPRVHRTQLPREPSAGGRRLRTVRSVGRARLHGGRTPGDGTADERLQEPVPGLGVPPSEPSRARLKPQRGCLPEPLRVRRQRARLMRQPRDRRPGTSRHPVPPVRLIRHEQLARHLPKWRDEAWRTPAPVSGTRRCNPYPSASPRPSRRCPPAPPQPLATPATRPDPPTTAVAGLAYGVRRSSPLRRLERREEPRRPTRGRRRRRRRPFVVVVRRLARVRVASHHHLRREGHRGDALVPAGADALISVHPPGGVPVAVPTRRSPTRG